MISKEVYFDTNVYTHIFYATKGRIKESAGITSSDVARLIAAVKSDKLRIIASVTNVEETIAAYLSDPEESIGRLKLIRRLAQRERIINSHTDLLKNDIRAFTEGKPLPPAFISPPHKLVKIVMHPDKVEPVFFRRIAEETKAQIDQIRTNHGEFYVPLREMAKELKETDEQPSFELYWEAMYLGTLEIIADLCGVLEKCKRRGIANLLHLRSVRLAAFTNISMSYALTFERSSVESGYSRDMHHGALSAATGVFITHDKKFRRIMSRMHFPDYCVMGLKELLQNIS